MYYTNIITNLLNMSIMFSDFMLVYKTCLLAPSFINYHFIKFW